MRYHHTLLLFVTVSCSAPTPQDSGPLGDAARTQDSTPRAEAPTIYLGRAGKIEIDLPAFRRSISETRILRSWRTGKSAPLTALKNQRLRKDILTRALETRLVRREVDRRGLVIPPKDMRELLIRAALGVAPDKHLSRAQYAKAPKDIDRLEAKIVARFGAPLAHVKRVAQDFVEHRVLAEDLLASVSEAERKALWRREKTCLRLELFRIPRVPTSTEITQAVKERSNEFEQYYGANPRLFKTPARTFVRRFLLPNTESSKDMESKKQLTAYRQKIEGGADMEALVRQHGLPRDRRSGGRLTVSQKKRPDFHGMKAGTLTAIEQHPDGWVFYKVEGHGVAVHRLLSDSRVRREIAAALLRRDDRLIHAKQTAGLIALRLRQGRRDADFQSLLKKERIRTSETPLFCLSKARLIPTIGLAPELTTSVFKLSEKYPVGSPVRVRQDYIVARLVERQEPTDEQWQEQATSFTTQWLARERPVTVKKWIRSQLDPATARIDMKRVNGLSLDQLRWNK